GAAASTAGLAWFGERRRPRRAAWFGERLCWAPTERFQLPEMNSSRVQYDQGKEKIMKPNTRLTKTFIGLMALAAIAATVHASLASRTLHPAYALAVLALAAATSRMKIKLPGIDGNMSVN